MEILNHCGNSLKAIFLCTIDANALFMFLLGSVESLVHLATVTRLAESILYCDNAEREIRVLSSSSWLTVLCVSCVWPMHYWWQKEERKFRNTRRQHLMELKAVAWKVAKSDPTDEQQVAGCTTLPPPTTPLILLPLTPPHIFLPHRPLHPLWLQKGRWITVTKWMLHCNDRPLLLPIFQFMTVVTHVYDRPTLSVTFALPIPLLQTPQLSLCMYIPPPVHLLISQTIHLFNPYTLLNDSFL